MPDQRLPDHRFLSPASCHRFDTGIGSRRPAPRRTPHDGRSARQRPDTAADAAGARRFAESTLRHVLEVLNRRRPPGQLRELVAPRVMDMVRTRTAAARQPIGLAGPARVQFDSRGTAEFFAVYTAGTRAGAIAGHLSYRRGRWHMDVLRIG